MSKMYILVRESVPDSFVPVIAAHASLIAYLAWEDTDAMREWKDNSFRKVVVSVSDKKFESFKSPGESRTVTESALGGIEVALVFHPLANDERLKKLPLWKPKGLATNS